MLLICSLIGITAKAQNRFGIDVGIGCPPGYGPGLNFSSDSHEIQTSKLLPCAGIYYERKITQHLYLGGKLFFQRYNFNNNRSTISNLFDLMFGGTTDTTNGVQVNCKSSYICLAPILDIGLGKKQVIHLFFMPGIGRMIDGTMTTTYYRTYSAGKFVDYSYTYNTTSALHPVIFPVSYGMAEHITLSKLWHLTFTETICNMVGNPIADEKWTDQVPLKPSYVSLQVGVMRKHHPKKLKEKS
ncbi:hypothetical protein CJD36_002290 [Flavipsychrobacter stenotrophus]|uniref:Outer membrane protein beta-barrel domain-containing protein n=2 Tax=Flavipsychrobacter stenotrophus TaxID=2077091 RepID=A0A2S7T1G3_9BACT|nr:hypothetical protein CJD36_002290 [Flavipsychrobacter stenotrophus]